MKVQKLKAQEGKLLLVGAGFIGVEWVFGFTLTQWSAAICLQYARPSVTCFFSIEDFIAWDVERQARVRDRGVPQTGLAFSSSAHLSMVKNCIDAMNAVPAPREERKGFSGHIEVMTFSADDQLEVVANVSAEKKGQLDATEWLSRSPCVWDTGGQGPNQDMGKGGGEVVLVRPRCG